MRQLRTRRSQSQHVGVDARAGALGDQFWMQGAPVCPNGQHVRRVRKAVESLVSDGMYQGNIWLEVGHVFIIILLLKTFYKQIIFQLELLLFFKKSFFK